jgi:hypothetical protein
MAEHQAREELRKKEMAERRAKEEQKRKEMAEHRAKEQERERERRKERAEHRGRDEHKAAGNVAPQTFAPPPPPPSVPRQGFAPPQQAAPAVPATPKQGFSALHQAAPAIPVAPKQEVVAPQKPAPAPVATAAPASPLVVRTYPASGVRGGSAPGAVLNAYTSFPDKSGRVWFEWGDSPSFGQSTNAEAFKGEKSVGQFTYVPAAKKKYYYRAIAEASGFLVYGETQSFVVP